MYKILTIILFLISTEGCSNSYHKYDDTGLQKLSSACRSHKSNTPESSGLKLFFDSPENKTKCFIKRLDNSGKPAFLSITKKENKIIFQGNTHIFGHRSNQDLLDYFFNSPDYSIKSFSGTPIKNFNIRLDVINREFAILVTESESNYAAIFSLEKIKNSEEYLLKKPYDLVFFKNDLMYKDSYKIKLYGNKADLYFGDRLLTIPEITIEADGRINFIPRGDKYDVDRLVQKLSNSLDRIDGKKSNYSLKWINSSGLLSVGSKEKIQTHNKDRLSHWVRRYLKKYRINLRKNKSLSFMTDIAVYRAMDHYNDKGELIW